MAGSPGAHTHTSSCLRNNNNQQTTNNNNMIFVCGRGSVVAPGWILMVPCSSLTLTTFGREIRHCFEVFLLVEFGMGFCWVRCEVSLYHASSAVVLMVVVTFWVIVLFLLWLRSVNARQRCQSPCGTVVKSSWDHW